MADDTIDLHGQFVEEAEDILETRIRAAVGQGQDHLHVIVGKGNHSPGHVQKIKPKVEQVCEELGIAYRTEENEGRIYLDLRGSGSGGTANAGYGRYQQPAQAYGQTQQHGEQPQYGYQQPQPYQSQQQAYIPGQQRPPQQMMQEEGQQQQQDPLTACLKGCCIVM